MVYRRNSKVFEKIDSEKKAYWLGFIFADGFVEEKEGYVLIGLKRSDKEHLEKFRDFLETDCPIKDKINNGGHEYSQIRLWDRTLVSDLGRFGLCRNKSLILVRPYYLREDLIRHFIRGYFDGDGSLYYQGNTMRMSVVGTEDMLLYFQEKMQISIKLDWYNKKIPKFTVSDKQTSLRCMKYLYENSTISLERKYRLYQEAQSII